MAVAPLDGFKVLMARVSGLSMFKQILLWSMVVMAIGIAAIWYLYARTPEYKVLFRDIKEKDAGEVVASLNQMQVKYQLVDGGTTILVASDKVYDARLKLAAQGLPKGTAGFELFDNQKLGMGEFEKQVNYQRALEGELARTIQSLAGVETARVHLAIPKDRVFLSERQKPTASVVLGLRSGGMLDAQQVKGIMYLISSSVPEMPMKNVSVVDNGGNLLSPNMDTAAASGLDATQQKIVREIQQGTVSKIEEILTPVLGRDNVRAQVTAQMDFTQTEQTSESYSRNPGPAESSLRSEKTVESSGVNVQGPQGVPGALANQPPGAASAPIVTTPGPTAASTTPSTAFAEKTRNYELDKVIRHDKGAVGNVKRVSAAVVVNYRKVLENDKWTLKPLTEKEMTDITNLVKEAMGFDDKRGDSVKVMNAMFSGTDIETKPVWERPETFMIGKELLQTIVILLVILSIFMFVIRPILRDLVPTPEEREAFPELGEDLDTEDEEPEEEISPDVVKLSEEARKHGDYQKLLELAQTRAREDPRIVAAIVKEWMMQKDE